MKSIIIAAILIISFGPCTAQDDDQPDRFSYWGGIGVGSSSLDKVLSKQSKSSMAGIYSSANFDVQYTVKPRLVLRSGIDLTYRSVFVDYFYDFAAPRNDLFEQITEHYGVAELAIGIPLTFSYRFADVGEISLGLSYQHTLEDYRNEYSREKTWEPSGHWSERYGLNTPHRDENIFDHSNLALELGLGVILNPKWRLNIEYIESFGRKENAQDLSPHPIEFDVNEHWRILSLSLQYKFGGAERGLKFGEDVTAIAGGDLAMISSRDLLNNSDREMNIGWGSHAGAGFRLGSIKDFANIGVDLTYSFLRFTETEHEKYVQGSNTMISDRYTEENIHLATARGKLTTNLTDRIETGIAVGFDKLIQYRRRTENDDSQINGNSSTPSTIYRYDTDAINPGLRYFGFRSFDVHGGVTFSYAIAERMKLDANCQTSLLTNLESSSNNEFLNRLMRIGLSIRYRLD